MVRPAGDAWMPVDRITTHADASHRQLPMAWLRLLDRPVAFASNAKQTAHRRFMVNTESLPS
jgi:hypothetical protein